MKFRRYAAALGAAVLPLAFAVPTAQAEETVTFSLNELNNSGATATATLTANDDGSLHVQIKGTGYTANAPHAQHIHGSGEGQEFFCPPQSTDDNGDGQIATEEAIEEYGGVFLSLTTSGDVSADSGLAVDRMPIADANGNIDYSRTIPASDLPEGLVENLEHLHIVQHGLDVNGNGTYDLKALGESVFAKSLGVSGIPEEATNPAACGEVTPTGGVETGAASTDGPESLALFGFGGLALAGAGGALLLRRRMAEQV